MHMADALVSPAVGGTMWLVTAGLVAHCSRNVRQDRRENLTPMMGVLGAFVFAAQMINFSIPGTGSSGHLGGGLLLAILLGPYPALLVIASVLTVQALFFADGGLLALGCNIFNMGVYPAFIAYPLIYRFLAGQGGGRALWVAAIAAGVAGMELGAFSVVLQTTASGISELTFGSFLLLMLPVHLAIGIVEGAATGAVVSFVSRARPQVFSGSLSAQVPQYTRSIWISLLLSAFLIGGVVSWFASSAPDGLEWSIAKLTGGEEIRTSQGRVEKILAKVQGLTSILPDYSFRGPEAPDQSAPPADEKWPAVSAGTSAAGVLGGLITLVLASGAGFALRALHSILRQSS